MFLLDWYSEWKMIRATYKVEKRCESCDLLGRELALAREMNSKLLDKVINSTTPPIEIKNANTDERPIQIGTHQLWARKRSILEAESRAAAKVMNQNKSNDITIDELEQEMSIVAAERVNESKGE